MTEQHDYARVTQLIAAPLAPKEEATWAEWLAQQLDPDWRSDEWNADRSIWTPNPDSPMTAYGRCNRPGCSDTSINTGPRAVCEECNSEKRRNKWTMDQLLATPLVAPRSASSGPRPRCAVIVDGVQCGFDAVNQELCKRHYSTYKTSKEPLSVSEYVVRGCTPGGDPLVALERVECANPYCSRSAEHPTTTLCYYCADRVKRSVKSGQSASLEDWVARFAEPEKPFGTVLLGLIDSEVVRLELRFALQSFDRERHGRLYPLDFQRLVRAAREAEMTTLVGHGDWLEDVGGVTSNARSLSRYVGEALDRAHRQFIGYDNQTADILYFEDLNLKTTASEAKSLRRPDPMDLRLIKQVWLREAFRSWVLVTLPPRHHTKSTFRAVVEASTILNKRKDHGLDPTAVHLADMTRIVDGLHSWATPEGASLPVRSYIRHILQGWWSVNGHARRMGLWDEVPNDFTKDPALHKNRGVESEADDAETGKSLPPDVVKHLRNCIYLLEGSTAELRHCVLTVLIDTGRRPNEVASLHLDCLGKDAGGGWVLKYNNHKAGRMGRKLAIQSETAEAIQKWQAKQKELGIDSVWLFPTPRVVSGKHDAHISASGIGSMVDDLVKVAPPIDAPVMSVDGEPTYVDLPALAITSYDFRHSYAQRHADNGVQLDVLMKLMDHKNAQTTMQYYRVNQMRLREAADAVAPFTQNAHGDVVGMSSGRRGLSTVAVPWGGCSEPSNVKAGGTDCPVRFQCASCSFYRPDPSYIPEIETHIASLKMNLAAARQMEAAPYVIANFEGQIEDYRKVVEKMETQLAGLSEEKRAEIEAAAAILRRGRVAAASGMSLSLTVIPSTTAGTEPTTEDLDEEELGA